MNEEKGFIIKDRRTFDEKGERRTEKTEEEPQRRPVEEPRRRSETRQAPPLPEADFNSLIFSLSSTVLLHLGEVPDPQTNEKRKDLPLAKHTIDTIAMLKEKTKGNLDAEEQRFIDAVLTDLRLRFVRASK